ncbi:hypothetical protein KC367_g235 [Hortaea werneckii]|nr:hypothetical protein KC367_g235 [Hortaea werneckii]
MSAYVHATQAGIRSLGWAKYADLHADTQIIEASARAGLLSSCLPGHQPARANLLFWGYLARVHACHVPCSSSRNFSVRESGHRHKIFLSE